MKTEALLLAGIAGAAIYLYMRPQASASAGPTLNRDAFLASVPGPSRLGPRRATDEILPEQIVARGADGRPSVIAT